MPKVTNILNSYKCLILEEFFWSDMNVGFALDEGIAVPEDTIPVYYGERDAYIIIITEYRPPEISPSPEKIIKNLQICFELFNILK